jgi:ribonuclease Z
VAVASATNTAKEESLSNKLPSSSLSSSSSSSSSQTVEDALTSLAGTMLALLAGNEEEAKLLISSASVDNNANNNNANNSNNKNNNKRSLLLQKTFDAYDVCESGILNIDEAKQLFEDLARSIVTEIAYNSKQEEEDDDDEIEIEIQEEEEEDLEIETEEDLEIEDENIRKGKITKKTKTKTKIKTKPKNSIARSHARRVLANDEAGGMDTISRVATKLLLLADVDGDGKISLPELAAMFDTVQKATTTTTTTTVTVVSALITDNENNSEVEIVKEPTPSTFPQPLRALAGSLQLLPPTEGTVSSQAANKAINYNIGVPGDDHTLRKVQLNNELSIVGLGRSADASTYYIPELGIVFDAGIHIKSIIPKTVLLTHAHRDHIGALPVHANINNGNSSSGGQPKTKIFVPKAISKLVKRYLLAEAQLNYGNENQTDQETIDALGEYDITGVEDGDEITLPKSAYIGSPTPIGIEVFQATHKHGVPAVSYGIYRKKSRLKKEYSTLSKIELGQIIRNNSNSKDDVQIQITESYNDGLIFYTGDTTIELLRNRWKDILLKYKYIIHEVTFLEDESSVKLDLSSKQKGHTHYMQLHPFICSFPNTTFILVHWSLQYTKSDILNFFDVQYGGVPSNIVLWI